MAASTKEVIDKVIEFVEVKTEQIKLKIITRIARLLSGVIALSISVLFGMFFLFFLSYALAEVLNDVLESDHLGFFIISGLYLLVIIIMVLLVKSKKLQHWIENFIVKLEEARYEQEED